MHSGYARFAHCGSPCAWESQCSARVSQDAIAILSFIYFLLEISVKIRYLAAVLALASFSAHAGATLNGLQLNGFRLNGANLNGLQLNGLRLKNGLHMNGLPMNAEPGTSAPANALVDLGSRPLVVQE